MTEVEEKWWLARSLTEAQREEVRNDPTKKAERRIQAVQWRMENEYKRLTDSRRRRLSLWLRSWIRGEAFRELTHDDVHVQAGNKTLKEWLRYEFLEALKGAFAGRDVQKAIDSTIRAEVGKVLTANKWTSDANGRDAFQTYVKKVVAEEVKRQIEASITIQATIRGNVHSAAEGARALQIGTDE